MAKALATARPVLICQDGANFYNDWTGQLLFTSPRPVGISLERAKLARLDFLRYADSLGMAVAFEE
jgi:hypothetical protein